MPPSQQTDVGRQGTVQKDFVELRQNYYQVEKKRGMHVATGVARRIVSTGTVLCAGSTRKLLDVNKKLNVPVAYPVAKLHMYDIPHTLCNLGVDIFRERTPGSQRRHMVRRCYPPSLSELQLPTGDNVLVRNVTAAIKIPLKLSVLAVRHCSISLTIFMTLDHISTWAPSMYILRVRKPLIYYPTP